MKNSLYNIFSGLIGQLLSILIGIIVPRLILINLGSEINGLTSSVNQAISYLSLLEAGVGLSTLQALYKPLSIKDYKSMNSILSATNKYYKKTGIIYILLIIVFSVVYSCLIKTNIQKTVVFFVILLSGIPGAINFLFQAKFKILLQAEGKNYIVTNLGTITNIIINILKILLLSKGYGIIQIQSAYAVVSILQMMYIEYYVRKNYKWIDLNVEPNYKSIEQKNAVMIHQISSMIFSNTDVLILTIFSGLKIVSIYTMYTTLFSMMGTIISNVNNSVTFKLGEYYHSNPSKFKILLNAFESYNMVLTFSLYSTAMIFILPFLKIYTQGVKDINYIDKLLPILFVMQFLLSNGRTSANQVINLAGHFKKTQNRSILEAMINLLVSLIFVNFIGIYGVLLGTIVALLYRSNDMILYANHKILRKSSKKTYQKWITCFFIFICIYCLKLNFNLDNYYLIIGYSFVTFVIIGFVYFFVISIIDIESFFYLIKIIKIFISKIKYKISSR